MTPEQFAYWLQGFAEMAPNTHPTPEQWAMIKSHLATVFHKVTPPLLQPAVVPSPGSVPLSPTPPVWPHDFREWEFGRGKWPKPGDVIC